MQIVVTKPEPNALSYHELIDSLNAAIYICNSKGFITYYNKAAARLWGREPELGKDLWCGSWKISRSDGSDMPLNEYPMAITLKEGREVDNEMIIVECPDGSRHFVEPHPKPLFDGEGNITGAINMLIDITEKKMAEKAILENEEKYRLLAESLEQMVSDRTMALQMRNEEIRKSEERYHKMVEEVQDYAIILLDKNGIILNWNKGAEKIKGYTEKEIIGKSFETFYLPEDRKNKVPEKFISEAAKNGKALYEGWRLRKDGTTFWGSIAITALHNDENEVIGFSKVTRDLTERKLAEEKMKQYNNELEFQNRELEQFAFAASHDLQEPLRKIQTFSQLIKDKISDEILVARYLDKINKSANRMSDLIKDVLSYSQLSKNDDTFKEVNLNEVIKAFREDFEIAIAEKEVVINAVKLPVVKGVPSQLRQLFSNLLSNSIKFSEKNPVIDISFTPVTADEIKEYPQLNHHNHNYVKILFKDNGIGFEQQYANQIFKLFQRLDGARSGGTGIGLALCKKIIENHHGHIFAESEVGSGTTFTVYLPV